MDNNADRSNIIGSGASSFIARCLGAEEYEKATHTLTAAFLLTVINSILVTSVSMCRMSFQAMGKPLYAFVITLIRQIGLYIPLLFLLNRLFRFEGMLFAQPVTEAVMMTVSIVLLIGVIKDTGEKDWREAV